MGFIILGINILVCNIFLGESLKVRVRIYLKMYYRFFIYYINLIIDLKNFNDWNIFIWIFWEGGISFFVVILIV